MASGMPSHREMMTKVSIFAVAMLLVSGSWWWSSVTSASDPKVPTTQRLPTCHG